jgi:hypothetical protein
VIASLAASRTDTLLDSGETSLVALTGGYHVGFLVGALFSAAAAALGAALLRPVAGMAGHGEEERFGAPATAEAE